MGSKHVKRCLFQHFDNFYWVVLLLLLSIFEFIFKFFFFNKSDTCFTSIFFWPTGSSFHFLTISFEEQMFLILLELIHFFLVWIVLLVLYLRNPCQIQGYKHFLLFSSRSSWCFRFCI